MPTPSEELPEDVENYPEDFYDFVQHRGCTPGALKKILALSDDYFVLRMIAEHENVTVEILVELAGETDDIDCLQLVVENPKCPASIYQSIYERSQKLAGEQAVRSGMGIDWALDIEKAFAAKPLCPEAILVDLSDHYDAELKALVAANPNTTTEVLDRLYRDRSKKVIEGIARNPNTSGGLLEKIYSSKSKCSTRTRELVLSHPNFQQN